MGSFISLICLSAGTQLDGRARVCRTSKILYYLRQVEKMGPEAQPTLPGALADEA